MSSTTPILAGALNLVIWGDIFGHPCLFFLDCSLLHPTGFPCFPILMNKWSSEVYWSVKKIDLSCASVGVMIWVVFPFLPEVSISLYLIQRNQNKSKKSEEIKRNQKKSERVTRHRKEPKEIKNVERYQKESKESITGHKKSKGIKRNQTSQKRSKGIKKSRTCHKKSKGIKRTQKSRKRSKGLKGSQNESR